MMQEYDDDFFFEEDKIFGDIGSMWKQNDQFFLFNDPRIFPQLGPVPLNIYEDRMNDIAETNSAVKKSTDTWDPERKRKLRERIIAMRLAAEKRRKRNEPQRLAMRPNRSWGASNGNRFDPRTKAAGSSPENTLPGKGLVRKGPLPERNRQRQCPQNTTASLPTKAGSNSGTSLPQQGTVRMGPFPEWHQRRRLARWTKIGPPPPLITVTSQESTKDMVEVNDVPEEKPTDEKNDLDSPDCIFNDLRQERYMIHHQDLMGMTVTSGSVLLKKDEKNLIGISIGGGPPLCPCLYIVQIFEGTPASKDGILQCGDELVGINGQSVKGKTKVEVAKMIQNAKDEVTINYNKLHADPKQGISLDIITKKVKHRLVEKMSSGTADALGLSRAILCNDTLVAKLDELKETESVYKKLVEHAKRMLKSYFDLLQTYKALGDIFASIGVREPQARASEAFTNFGQYHRVLEKDGIKMLKGLKPILADLGTYLNKAIPDTKLTIRKYADVKFEYLSYCLKVKEMDDEEYGFNAMQEPLYRVETGNYEYRLILRCRQEARERFARLRSDVLVKLELLENKKTQDVALQLRRFIAGFAAYHDVTLNHLKDNASLFPIEVDLSQNAFQYKSTAQIMQDNAEDEEEIEFAKELKEFNEIVEQQLDSGIKDHKVDNRRPTGEKDSTETSELLLPDFDSIDNFAQSDNASQNNFDTGNGNIDKTGTDCDKTGNFEKPDAMDDMSLLTELGLADFNDFSDFQGGVAAEFTPINLDPQNVVDDVFTNMLNDL